MIARTKKVRNKDKKTTEIAYPATEIFSSVVVLSVKTVSAILIVSLINSVILVSFLFEFSFSENWYKGNIISVKIIIKNAAIKK